MYKRLRPEEYIVRNQGTTGRRWFSIVGAGILLALPVEQAFGQDTGSGLELTGYIGALLPLSSFASQGDTIKVELSTRQMFAASLDYRFSGSWGIQVMGGYAQPELTVLTVDPEGSSPISTDVGSVDFLHAEATLLYRPRLPGAKAALLPYFGVGAGIRSLSFPDESGSQDSDDITFIVTAGSHIKLGNRVYLRLDIRDLISSFDSAGLVDSKLQNEFLINVGLGIGL